VTQVSSELILPIPLFPSADHILCKCIVSSCYSTPKTVTPQPR
jgi:hypothetical protein